MPTVTIDAHIDAPPSTVWEVLEDFGGIERWSPGVRRSVLETAGPIGVGTTRHCDFTPLGSAKERIEEYVPQKRMRVSLDEIRAMPIRAAEAVFTLAPVTSGTDLRFEYTFTVAPGARLLERLLPPLLRGGLKKLVGGLKAESERLAAPAP